MQAEHYFRLILYMAASNANQKKNSPKWVSSAYALTGSIGSGKSTVAKLLSDRGAFVVSADQLARDVVEPGSAGLRGVIEAFGVEYLNNDGSLNRRALGQLVFNDRSKRLRLEEIVIPLIQGRANGLFSQSALTSRVKIYEVPLLFEKGIDVWGFRGIILVCAAAETCVKRAVLRDQISEEEIKSRLSAQIPIEKKRAASTFIVENDGTLAELESQVAQLFSRLKP